jgi:hypothetical protein
MRLRACLRQKPKGSLLISLLPMLNQWAIDRAVDLRFV